VVAEVLLLGVAGGALGLLTARAALSAFVAAAPSGIPRLDEASIDVPIVLFTFALAAVCGLVAGLLPALCVSASDPQSILRAEAVTASAGRGTMRLRELLVGCEAGAGTVLVLLAALLAVSLGRVLAIPKGFSAEQALAAAVDTQDGERADRLHVFDRALAELRVVPGVRAAALVSRLPLTGESNVNQVELEGADQAALDPATHQQIEINVRFISGDYFAALGIPLLRGRAIEARDAGRPVAVVSARTAARLWPGRDPLGRRFTTGSRVGKVEVIGVVEDVSSSRLEQGPTLIAYVPYWERHLRAAELVVRSATPPQAMAPAVRNRIREVDAQAAVPRLRTLGEVVSESVAQRRFQLLLASGFALAAVLLAALGIYGVTGFSVAQRRAEIGVRMALGARPGQVVGYFVGRGLRPVVLGVAGGVAAAVPCGQLVRSLLFGVSATEPLALAAVAAVLVAVAFLACLGPALSAARTDPVVVLRRG
jgi:predicted permease